MFKNFVAFMVAGTMVVACTPRNNGVEPGESVRFAQYIAGVSLLTTLKSRGNDSARLQHFRELGDLTGLSADSAETFCASLRDNPEKGRDFYQLMTRLYESQSDTTR